MADGVLVAERDPEVGQVWTARLAPWARLENAAPVESSDGACFSVNLHTEDCGCPSIYTPQLVMVTDGPDFDDRYRFMYICC